MQVDEMRRGMHKPRSEYCGPEDFYFFPKDVLDLFKNFRQRSDIVGFVF